MPRFFRVSLHRLGRETRNPLFAGKRGEANGGRRKRSNPSTGQQLSLRDVLRPRVGGEMAR